MFAANFINNVDALRSENIEGIVPTTDIRYRTPVQAVNAPAVCVKMKFNGKGDTVFYCRTSKTQNKMNFITRKMYRKAQSLYITPLFFIPYYIYILSLWGKSTPLTALEYLTGAFMYLVCPIAIEWAVRHHISIYRQNSKK